MLAAGCQPGLPPPTTCSSSPPTFHAPPIKPTNYLTNHLPKTKLQKFEYSSDVLDALNALKAAGGVPKWGSEAPEAGAAGASRRSVMQGELRQAGIKVCACV